ncbi:uncharacterized protein FTOL_07681 [Fusarium torulosum]|uniref:Uncharacterized protein n=1 Tax=Fusarium torulosum TaxID=33205 RepID=A0AAE8MBF3_9HYPO|nr:uncharacterized protein FTOL_07681 [Fusarium torulosum]
MAEQNPMRTDLPPYSFPAEENIHQIINTWSLESRVVAHNLKKALLKITTVVNDVTQIKNDIASIKSEIYNMKDNITQLKIQTTLTQRSLKEAHPILEAIEVKVGQTYGDIGSKIDALGHHLETRVDLAIDDINTNIDEKLNNLGRQDPNMQVPPPQE